MVFPTREDLDTLDCELIAKVEAPFDSGDHPASVLIQGDDIEASSCDNCGIPAEDFPRHDARLPAVPAAMFQAALYCADCQTHAYDDNGNAVWTLTGLAIF